MIRSVGIFFGFYEVKSGQMGMIILPPGGSARFAGILWDVYLALILNNFFAAQWEVLQFAMVTEMTVVWWQMAKSTMYDNRGGGGGQREQKVQSEERPNVL